MVGMPIGPELCCGVLEPAWEAPLCGAPALFVEVFRVLANRVYSPLVLAERQSRMILAKSKFVEFHFATAYTNACSVSTFIFKNFD
jgi:hypothetical protein